MCASSESSGEILKMHKLKAYAISEEISCIDTYTQLYTLQVYLGWWTRPHTYICSASAELKVVWVLEVRTLSGKGVSALVCTRRVAFEIDWWWFGVFQ